MNVEELFDNCRRKRHDCQKIKTLLQRSYHPDKFKTDKDVTLLQRLVDVDGERCIECITALLNRKADINHVCKNGFTVLMYASWTGDEDVIRMLLQRGVTLNERNRSGATALWLATYMGHVSVLKILLKAGADPTIEGSNYYDEEYISPLQLSLLRGHMDCYDVLEEWSTTHPPVINIKNDAPNDGEDNELFKEDIKNIESAIDTNNVKDVDVVPVKDDVVSIGAVDIEDIVAPLPTVIIETDVVDIKDDIKDAADVETKTVAIDSENTLQNSREEAISFNLEFDNSSMSNTSTKSDDSIENLDNEMI